MKIYLYDPETGIYLGEDFADVAPMQLGAFVMPAGATAIAPPEVEPGRVLLFNALAQRWEVSSRPDLDQAVRGLPDFHPSLRRSEC